MKEIINNKLYNNITNFLNNYNFLSKDDIINQLSDYYGTNIKKINFFKNKIEKNDINFKLPLEFEIFLSKKIMKNSENLYNKLKKDDEKLNNKIKKNNEKILVSNFLINNKKVNIRKILSKETDNSYLTTITNSINDTKIDSLCKIQKDNLSFEDKIKYKITKKDFWIKQINKIEKTKKVQFKNGYEYYFKRLNANYKKENTKDFFLNEVNDKISEIQMFLKYKNKNIYKKVENIKNQIKNKKSWSPRYILEKNKIDYKIRMKNKLSLNYQNMKNLKTNHQNNKAVVLNKYMDKYDNKSEDDLDNYYNEVHAKINNSYEIYNFNQNIKEDKIPYISINNKLKEKFK